MFDKYLTILLSFLIYFFALSSFAQDRLSGDAISGTIAMSCRDGSAPPCVIPDDTPAEFISPNPDGRMTLVCDDAGEFGECDLAIRLRGLAPNLVITAWNVYFSPANPPDNLPDLFADGVARVATPLAPTTAAYTEGMGLDPNVFSYLSDAKARYSVNLDFNIMAAGNGPLVNQTVFIDQSAAPENSEAYQPPFCCPTGEIPSIVGASLLRHFDPVSGRQIIREDGMPSLIRSPLPTQMIAVVVHLDKTTHGLYPGIPILPNNFNFTLGDTYLLGLFQLADLVVDDF